MARTDYYQDPHAPQANNIVVAVTAFVLNDQNDLLMIRRTDNNKYSIPGGAQDIGETIGHTVAREVKEETGYDVEATGLIGIYSDPAHIISYANGEVRQEFSICFRARLIGGQPQTSSESKEVLWVSKNNIQALDIHSSIRLRIAHGFEFRATPFFSN